MRLLSRILIFMIGPVLICTCASRETVLLRRELRTFMSNTVVTPAGMQGVDTAGVFFYKDKSDLPKLIFYYDSASCSDCEIAHLTSIEWLYRKSSEDGTFEVLTIFSPKPEDYEVVRRLLDIHRFPYPVYIDFDGRFRKANNFIPEDVRFHTFLTDSAGKIVYVGNPSMSEDLRTAFEKVLESIAK